jgi:hypothetical protein
MLSERAIKDATIGGIGSLFGVSPVGVLTGGLSAA